jgi:hypothetical protein
MVLEQTDGGVVTDVVVIQSWQEGLLQLLNGTSRETERSRGELMRAQRGLREICFALHRDEWCVQLASKPCSHTRRSIVCCLVVSL